MAKRMISVYFSKKRFKVNLRKIRFSLCCDRKKLQSIKKDLDLFEMFLNFLYNLRKINIRSDAKKVHMKKYAFIEKSTNFTQSLRNLRSPLEPHFDKFS